MNTILGEDDFGTSHAGLFPSVVLLRIPFRGEEVKQTFEPVLVGKSMSPHLDQIH